MGSTLFRDPQVRSSALAALGTLQPRAFGSLNRVDPLDSVSNYYIAFVYIAHAGIRVRVPRSIYAELVSVIEIYPFHPLSRSPENRSVEFISVIEAYHAHA